MRKKRIDGEKKGVTYRKGYRRNIIRLLLTCGAISKKGLHMLGDNNYRQYIMKLKEMEEEGIVEEVRVLSKGEGYHKTMRLRNVKPTNEKFMEEFPTYMGHYYRYAINNAKNLSFSQKSAAIKSYRESETILMLAPTSIRVFPNEKIAIREERNIPTYPPSFYNSLEIREGEEVKIRTEGKEKADIISSRAIGMIISEGGIYGVYHTEDKQIRWVKSVEGQFTNAMARLVNRRCVDILEEEKERLDEEKERIRGRNETNDKGIEKFQKVENGILIGKNNDIFVKTYQNTKAGKINLYESGYKRLFSVPYSKEGQLLLEIMMRKGWEKELKDIYLADMNTNTRMSSVPCDAIDGDKFILLFCIPDMIKLRKFLNVAMYENEPEKYQIYCFDFQEEFVAKVAGRYAEINYAELSTYCEYRGIKVNPL